MEMLAMPLATIIRYPASRYPIYIYIYTREYEGTFVQQGRVFCEQRLLL